jgi:C4-type Zn-finger protein
MTTSEGQVARIEGVLEQMNERLGNIEAQNLRLLDQKAENERVANIERILEHKSRQKRGPAAFCYHHHLARCTYWHRGNDWV